MCGRILGKLLTRRARMLARWLANQIYPDDTGLALRLQGW
jgi:hypothetical protein